MIELKPLDTEDLEYRVILLNHKDIAPYINTKEVFTIEKTQDWFQIIKNQKTRADFVFMSNNKAVGMGGLTNISEDNKNCELYMFMDPSFQGKGLGFKSCFALCKYVFEVLDLNKVYLYTFKENTPANKLYEKIGFKREGVFRSHTFKKGTFKDRFFYGILK